MEKEKEEIKNDICRILTKIGAIKFGTFKLTTGKISPYYIDLRTIPSFPTFFQKVCDVYLNIIKDEIGSEKFDRIAGIPTAGVPFAAIIAYRMKKPLFYIREHMKLHGRERKVEGILTSGDRVLLIDDLITSGKSLIKAASSIRTEGGVIDDVIVLIDREEGGVKNLAKEGITLHCLLKIIELANRLYKIGIISKDQIRIIEKQVKN